MLVRLMYASRAAAAVNHDELLAILRKSKVNNPRHGVTGVLCYSGGIFLQVLEGGRSAVNHLYNRIAAVLDPYAVSGEVSMALFQELMATASIVCNP